jgi:hypothetical protein
MERRGRGIYRRGQASIKAGSKGELKGRNGAVFRQNSRLEVDDDCAYGWGLLSA